MIGSLRRAALTIALLAPLGACAYYNSMYLAVHLARAADKDERAGRTFDAQSLWGQVAVKAETTLVRHPGSKWATPARFLQGKAYQRLGNCSRAVAPLERVRRESRDTTLVNESRILLGGCYTELGDPLATADALGPLSVSPDTALRREALYALGLAALMRGHPDSAIAYLSASGDPRADGRRAIALVRAGRAPAAIALADSLAARHDSALAWDSLFIAIGAVDPEGASALIDRRSAAPGVTADVRADWLVADGRRWLIRDSTRGLARMAEGVKIAPPGSESARIGTYVFADVWIARATDAADLDSAAAVLERYLVVNPGQTYAVTLRIDPLRRLVGALDSLAPAAPAGDLRTFAAAEFARDSIQAPKLAAHLFRRLAVEVPASPYTPKALLGLAALDPAAADSIAGVLATRYPASPYTLALRGVASPQYRILEDSLLAFSVARISAVKLPPRGGRRPARDTL
ncbi:MAG: tol-pal system YbgF family protein [Gemmatimonadales bacterium]